MVLPINLKSFALIDRDSMQSNVARLSSQLWILFVQPAQSAGGQSESKQKKRRRAWTRIERCSLPSAAEHTGRLVTEKPETKLYELTDGANCSSKAIARWMCSCRI